MCRVIRLRILANKLHQVNSFDVQIPVPLRLKHAITSIQINVNYEIIRD